MDKGKKKQIDRHRTLVDKENVEPDFGLEVEVNFEIGVEENIS